MPENDVAPVAPTTAVLGAGMPESVSGLRVARAFDDRLRLATGPCDWPASGPTAGAVSGPEELTSLVTWPPWTTRVVITGPLAGAPTPGGADSRTEPARTTAETTKGMSLVERMATPPGGVERHCRRVPHPAPNACRDGVVHSLVES